MARLLCAVVCACAASASLPALRPRKSTLACADPLAAQDFTLKYIGGLFTDQRVDGGNGSCAIIKWVDFTPWDAENAHNEQFHFHFVQASRNPSGPLSLVQMEGYVEWLHGDLNANQRDELSDQHVTLAAGNLDAFATLYRRDGVPFSSWARPLAADGSGNRTMYSVLVQVPHGILVEIVSDVFDSFEGKAYDDEEPSCAPRNIPTFSKAYFEALRTREPFSSEQLPVVVPHSMSFASTHPAEAAQFVEQFMGGPVVPQSLPEGCDGEIVIGLNSFENPTYPFYIQWLHHPKARKGSIGLSETEEYLEMLHGNLTEDHYDQYMDDHLGMETVQRGDSAFGPFVDEWRTAGLEWFHRMAAWDGVDSFLEAPGGVILETMVAEADGTHFGLAVVDWDICSPLPAPARRVPLPGRPATA
ncbi:hypothetical protein M885DRAFT_623545 [Pelagophyceae sp. CCMP2097]|nr:hypothetical protein M885DRAFT_623545 [Pelagophyceae sp. CCMP2097]